MNAELLRLYFIMGSTDAGNKDPLALLEQALQNGVTIFQFREKNSTLNPQEYQNFAAACQELCKHYNVPFIVDDDVKLALTLKADGVHIGTEDYPLPEIKKVLLPGQFLGYSVHNFTDLALAVTYKADYVGIGPVFPTVSKPDAKAPVGLNFLKSARQRAPKLPMVAIGGINKNNFTQVLATKMDGIAVISAICRNPFFARDFWATLKARA